MKMLVIDDEREMCKTFKQFFENRQCSVDTAYDGKEGVDKINRNNYDITILDINMPEMNEMEVISYIKRKNIGTVIIVCSGYDGVSEKFCRTLGANEFVQKPVSLTRMKELVFRHYDRGR